MPKHKIDEPPKLPEGITPDQWHAVVVDFCVKRLCTLDLLLAGELEGSEFRFTDASHDNVKLCIAYLIKAMQEARSERIRPKPWLRGASKLITNRPRRNDGH